MLALLSYGVGLGLHRWLWIFGERIDSRWRQAIPMMCGADGATEHVPVRDGSALVRPDALASSFGGGERLEGRQTVVCLLTYLVNLPHHRQIRN